ncbi:hypothetical protein RHS01_06520 [Rhizoctonia solani]|uniref:Transmembrane protein n=1 Tax=Rhizoctonia solani TaxID=456999 RepID=A0A8H7M447_9AGAM|nr:hypothetical protein RHS01_06520 [Rhizoctonia solani]
MESVHRSLCPNDSRDAPDSIPLVAFSSSRSNQHQNSSNVHVIPMARPAGWLGKFEPIPVVRLLVHMILCFLSFPVIFLVARAASGMSLFWTRLIVGGLCGGVGLTLGISLLDLSRACIEAALWATIIHESMKGEVGHELDYHTHNPLSPWSAILLLYRKYVKQLSSRNRKAIRRHDDRTPWWLCIVLFLVTATVAASLVFALGRVTQTKEYYEAAVAGDITAEEIARATTILNDTLSQVRYTWTITPLSSAQHVPTDRYFYLNRTEKDANVIKTTIETIHFAETFTSQLDPDHPFGFGTFQNQSQTAGLTLSDAGKSAGLDAGKGPTTKAVGQIARWPRTPHSRPANMTYLFVPWKAVDRIFEYMGLDSPPAAKFRPVNFTGFMEGEDRPNVTAQESEVALMSKWWDNGVTHSFSWFPVNQGEDGNGWVSIEIVMVRLNESYTAPNSSFQVYGELGNRENRTRIGFDAAICVEEVRGYVVDAYNSRRFPVSLALKYHGTQLNTSMPTIGQDASKHEVPKRIEEPLSQPGVEPGISSANKFACIMPRITTHATSCSRITDGTGGSLLRRLVRIFGQVVAFGGGNSPTEYTQLNAENIARVMANSDSQHLLPYLVGSQLVLAHVYRDKTVAYTFIYTTWLAIILAVVLVNGIVVSVFVPRLPLGLSRRDIGVNSWLAAIEGKLTTCHCHHHTFQTTFC